jgi:hypothetical protein
MNDIGYKDVDSYVRTLVSDELGKRAEDKKSHEDSSEEVGSDEPVSEADPPKQPKAR